MSLFNRKVLQIGVVANLTLLQKYCILNIVNTLAWKNVVNMLSMLEAALTADRIQLVAICVHITISANFMHIHMNCMIDIHICILCKCANYAYCNMRGIDDCKQRELDNVGDNKSWRSDNLNSNRFKFWILKSNKIQIWIKIWIQTCM
jgi:hypothetical protein